MEPIVIDPAIIEQIIADPLSGLISLAQTLLIAGVGWYIRRTFLATDERKQLEAARQQLEEQRLKVLIEQEARETLHSAAESGINMAADFLGVDPTRLDHTQREQIVEQAAQWVLGRGAGDSASLKGLDLNTVRTFLRGKLNRVAPRGARD